jgi:hypothetical protein
MSILVRFGKYKAFLRRGEWKCASRDLEDRLNSVTRDWIQETGGPPLEDHDHERTAAEEIARRLDGRIAMRVAPSPRRTRAIYISRRQLDFDFS